MPYIPTLMKSTREPSRFERTVRPARFSINPKHPLANGLVFAGLGNGQGYQFIDYSGQGNHGTLTNMEPSSDWEWSNYLNRFVLSPDGTDEIVDIPIPPVTTTPLTLACWFNVTSDSTIMSLIDITDYNNATSYEWILELSRGTAGRVGATTYSGGGSTAVSATAFTANNWHHGCAIINSATSRTAYLNGVPGTVETTSRVVAGVDRATLFANRSGSPTVIYRPTTGYVADPMIWNRALSPAEIQQLADPSNVMLDGLIVPDEPDRSITQKRVAIVRGVSFEKPKVRPEQFELDYDHPLAKGLVFAGLGNHSGSVRYNDSSHYGNHGVLTNMESDDWVFDSTLGRFALLFGGTNEYVLLPTLFASSMTLCCWFKCTDATTSTCLLASSSTAGVYGHELDLNRTAGKVSATSIVITAAESKSDASFSTASWQFACGVFVGDSFRQIYLNGVSSAAETTSKSVVPNTASIGARRIGSTTPDRYVVAGTRIADALAWNRAISIPEIQALADPSNVMLSGLIKPVQGTTKYFRGVTLSDAYTLKPHVGNGSGRPQHFEIDYSHQLAKGLVFAGLGHAPGSVRYNDSSGCGNHGTLTNMTPTTDWKYDTNLQRYSLSTGAISDKYVQGTCEHFDHWSFAIWMNPLDNTRRGIVSKSLLSDSWGDMTIRRESTGVCSIFRGTSAIHTTGAVVSSILSHLVVTYNRQYIRSYINGVFDTETAYTTAFGTAGQQLNIGAYYASGSSNWRGITADPLLYNRALSLAEIQQLADPSNVMLSGLIKEIRGPIPVPINDRHWVGRHEDWHSADNWSRSQGGRGGAGVPNENTNVYFD